MHVGINNLVILIYMYALYLMYWYIYIGVKFMLIYPNLNVVQIIYNFP